MTASLRRLLRSIRRFTGITRGPAAGVGSAHARAGRFASHRTRGAAGLAAVLVLLIVQLIVVGAVLAVARDNDMMTLHLDTVRAFYAAESGANMAIREAMRGVDEDGDGVIGGVSDDATSSDDPAIGSAHVAVTKTKVGSATIISATGRCGVTRRKATADVSGLIGGTTQTVMAAWSKAGSSIPRYSTWGGSTWNSATNMPTMAGEAKWVRMKICPTRNETTFIQEDLNKHVNVCFFNGSTWGTTSLLSSDTGGTNDRPEDIAYEQLSSDALCVYWKGTTSVFGYRTYNGTTFSSEQTFTSPFTTEADFLTLYPRPVSNDILALTSDGIAGNSLQAKLWNGSSWGSWTTMVASLDTNNQECYAAAFEAQTGRGIAAYVETGVNTPRYRTLTGTTWSSQSSMPTIGGVGKWLRLAADPTSNAILFAAVDGSQHLNANVWNGSAWGTNVLLNSTLPNYDRRGFDVIFERGTGRALIAYGVPGSNVLRYRTWNGTAWSAETNGPNLGANVCIVALSRGFTNGEVFVAVSDASSRLQVMRWDGSSMSGATIVETSLGGWDYYSSFAVPEPTVAPHPRVQSWAQVAP